METKKLELNHDIALDRHKTFQALSSELGYKCLSASEHEALLAKSTKSEEDIKADVDEQVQAKLADLQRQLDHELEKSKLAHAVDIARLEAEITHLRADKKEKEAPEKPEPVSSAPASSG